MARSITKQYTSEDGILSVLTLDRKVEDILEGSVQKTEVTSYLALEPNVAEKILTLLREAIETVTPKLDTSPLLLVSPLIRLPFRRFVERFIPDLVIVSHSEIVPTVQIKTLKVVNLNAN